MAVKLMPTLSKSFLFVLLTLVTGGTLGIFLKDDSAFMVPLFSIKHQARAISSVGNGFEIGRASTATRGLATPSAGLTVISASSDEERTDSEYGKDESSNNKNPPVVERLKRDLLAFAASYDRGYGATPSIRSKVQNIIDELRPYNPTTDAALGADGLDPLSKTSVVPLKGTWRLVWTTAIDVLSIASSPIATVSAIYQDIDPPVATNIIDLIPRAQAALPPGVLPTLLRAKVKTRTSRRSSRINRVGLVFESVEIRALEVLGVRVPDSFPLALGWVFPDVTPILNILGGMVVRNEDDIPGYFDVVYLDEDMLVYSQNDPGGSFVLVRVSDAEY